MSLTSPFPTPYLDEEAVHADVARVLDGACLLAGDPVVQKALGETGIVRLHAWQQTIRRLMEEPFTIVVAGDFKRGKSTLVNALAGKELVPMSATPETMPPTFLTYAETPAAEALLANGHKIPLNRADVSRERLTALRRDIPADITRIDIRENIPLLRNIRIIDTPGPGALFEEYDERVMACLAGADAVIYVVSARAPLSMTEREFFTAAGLGKNFPCVHVVINMADCLENEDNMDALRDRIEQKIRPVSREAQVFLLSGLDELCRVTNRPRPAPRLASRLESGYAEFHAALTRSMPLQQESIKAARCLTLCSAMLRDFSERLALSSAALRQGMQGVVEQESRIRNEHLRLTQEHDRKKNLLADKVETCRLEARQWMEAFLLRLRSALLDAQEADEESLHKYLRFFILERVRDALTACMDRHREQLRRLWVRSPSMQNPNFASTKFATWEALILEQGPDADWTRIDSAMFVTEQSAVILGRNGLPIGGPLLLIKALAGSIRNKTVHEKRSEMPVSLLANFDQLRTRIGEYVDTAYDSMRQSILHHQDWMDEERFSVSLDAVRNAKTMLIDKTEELAHLDSRLRSAREALDKMRRQLERYGGQFA